MDIMDVAIITRYNVRSPFAPEGFDVNDRTWLAGRRVLFEAHCAPSVTRQTDQRFTWYVLVDDDFPEDEAAALRELGGCTIVRCAFQTQGVARVHGIFDGSLDGLCLTIRLDSDDSIGPDFVRTMRAHAERNVASAFGSSDGLALCFSDGVEHDTAANTWYDRFYPNNPFIGFLESVRSGRAMRGPYHHAHYDMFRHYDMLMMKAPEPMWCIRVHGGNVANQIKGVERQGPPPEGFTS